MELSGSNLYVSGNFTTAGGHAVNHVAKWDGESWSALGDGINAPAYVLTVSGNDLYAGGRFTTAGGLPAHGIAKWDGSQWSPLGSGVDGEVFTVLVDGTDVYVGGSFTRAGGVEAINLAKWDGGQWVSLGKRRQDSDFEFQVTDMIMWRSDLYIAGAGLNRTIFRWEGVNWTELQDPDAIPGDHFGQISSFVPSLEKLQVLSYRFRDKSLYPGLVETTLSKWDGSSWLTFPIDEQTRREPNRPRPLGRLRRSALPVSTVSGNSLYLGDHNMVVGGKVSPLVSRYVLGAIPPLEIHGGRATVFFRESPDQSKGVIPGRLHRIERTVDLRSWETLGFRYAGETGGIDFTDEAAPADHAFYRAVPTGQ